MTGRYGRTELYVSRLPVRFQVGGRCNNCTLCYAAEMLGLLTNQPVVQLSQLDTWLHQDMNIATNINTISICSEQLWPASISYGPEQWVTGVGQSESDHAIPPPDAVAIADARNHQIEFGIDPVPKTKAEVRAVFDAGYCVSLVPRPNHLVIAWDDDDFGVYGLDSRAAGTSPYHQEWSAVLGQVQQVFKKATFSGVVAPHRINPFSPNNNANIVQAMRSLTAQWQARNLAVQPLQNELNALGSMSANQINRFWVLVDTLVANAQDKGLLASMVNALVIDATPIITPPTDEWDALIAQMGALATQLEAA